MLHQVEHHQAQHEHQIQYQHHTDTESNYYIYYEY